MTGVNDEIGDLEDRLAALKDKAESLGKKYVQAKKDSEKADREVQVLGCLLAHKSIHRLWHIFAPQIRIDLFATAIQDTVGH